MELPRVHSTSDDLLLRKKKVEQESPLFSFGPGLYFGSPPLEKDLTTAQVTHIMCLNSLCLCKTFSGAFNRLKVSDSEFSNLLNDFGPAQTFLGSVRKGILIHCGLGEMRSPTLAVVYLMVVEKLTLKEASDRVSSERTVNLTTYWQQLKALEKKLKSGG
ncbi:MAG: dual specificity protein phosphatase family protein [Parachlamydiales bacterium]